MSGTSLVGIDAAMIEIEIDRNSERVQWSLRLFNAVSYTGAQRATLHHAMTRGTAADLCTVHAQLGEWLAAAAIAVADAGRIDLRDVGIIGSHGQTVWHTPPADGVRGATLQLGCPATIAERTGVPVVSDFRARDMAAGGQGAPLVPWADRLLFSHPLHSRVLVNIGGMANLTWVPPHTDDARDVIAFDTGPGNVLVDAAVEIATGGISLYDDGGSLAAAGAVDDQLLDALLQHPYFSAAPPRSTGRELFGPAFVEDIVQRMGGDRAAAAHQLIPTLSEFTARSIAAAIGEHVQREIGEVIVTGGGARNDYIMRRLSALLSPLPVRRGKDVGIDGDAKEAIVFAALAWAHVMGIPGNEPAATGAAGARVLGSLTPGAYGRQLNYQ
jgi:anhydro-N-acetylmuramic acid kinase